MQIVIPPSGGETRALVVKAPHWQGSFPAFVAVLKRGVTRWMDETADGSRAKAEGRGVFTIADLADYTPDCFLKGTSLGGALVDAGIILCEIEVIETDVDATITGVDATTNLYEGSND